MSHDQFFEICSKNAYGILANGRSGTDFLQSLFDGHPEVLTFNGFFLFYEFWGNAVTNKSSSVNIEDFADEFIGKFIFKLKSKYDIQEQKDKLGINKDESIDINPNAFKNHFINLINKIDFNSKNCLIALTAAYHLSLERNLSNIKIFLHHPHTEDECKHFIKDFPQSTLICMTRDPRANIYSSIRNYFKYYPQAESMPLIFLIFNSIVLDYRRFSKYTEKIITISIENLNQKQVLLNLCHFFKIEYSSTLESSTFGGLKWHGDRLSKQNDNIGTSRDILKNDWESKLSKLDLLVINTLTHDMRTFYGYTNSSRNKAKYLLSILLCFIPLSFERNCLSFKILFSKRPQNFFINWLYFMKRVRFTLNQLTKNKSDFRIVHF